MTTQQAVIRNFFKNKLLGSICVFSSFLFSHFRAVIRIDIESSKERILMKY